MANETQDQEVAQVFADAASEILERRVQLAPVERHEERWLPGWKKRLRTYVTYSKD